jgi:hypothetical protein
MRFVRIPILAGALALAPLVGQAAGEDGSDLAAPLRAAADALASVAPKSDPMKPLTEVVGLLSQVVERARLSPDVRKRVDGAHAGLRKGAWSSEPAAVGELNEAYAALNGGRRFAFPPGVRSGEQAREAYRREVDRAVDALEKGRPADAAKPILESLLLVTTRMETH